VALVYRKVARPPGGAAPARRMTPTGSEPPAHSTAIPRPEPERAAKSGAVRADSSAGLGSVEELAAALSALSDADRRRLAELLTRGAGDVAKGANG